MIESTMQLLSDPNAWIAFLTLSALEIILGIDNIIFISVIANRLPSEIREKVRRFGLLFALVTRILLLLSLSWVMGLTSPLFSISDHLISGRDLILLLGGFFLIWKASKEIYIEVEVGEHGDEQIDSQGKGHAKSMLALFIGSVLQIGLLDIIFSLDSVITAVGMVDQISVMIAAVLASVLIMLIAAKPLSKSVLINASKFSFIDYLLPVVSCLSVLSACCCVALFSPPRQVLLRRYHTTSSHQLCGTPVLHLHFRLTGDLKSSRTPLP